MMKSPPNIPPPYGYEDGFQGDIRAFKVVPSGIESTIQALPRRLE